MNVPFIVLSQNQSLDSLSALLSQNNPDTARIKLFNALSFELLQANSLDSGYKAAEKALKLSQENDFIKGIAKAYANIGLYYNYSNDYNKAIKYYLESFEIFTMLGDTTNMTHQCNNIGNLYIEMASYDTALIYHLQLKELLSDKNDSSALANTFNSMALIYNSKGDLNKSLEYLLESLTIWECMQDEFGMSKAFCNIGMVYRRIGDYERALGFLEKALEIGNRIDAQRLLIDNYIQIGIVYKETGEYEKAIKNYKKGLEIAERLNFKKKIAVCLNNIGIVYYDMGKNELALEHYFKSLEIKQQLDDKHGIAVTTNNIALSYIDLLELNKSSSPGKEIMYFGSYDHIIELLLEAAALAEEIGNYQDLSNTYSSLILAYANNEQFEQAVIFQEKVLLLNDSIFTIEKNKDLIEIQARFEADQKQQQIEILNARNTAQELKMKRLDRERYFYLGGGISLMILVIGLISRMNFIRRTKSELQSKTILIEAEKKRAEENEKVKEQFLSKMSYEIRTPMNSVMGMADILINNKHYPEQDKYLDAVKQSSENLLVIINDILDFSKLESGKLELERAEFVLEEEVNNVCEILQFKAEEKHLSLACELDQTLPKVLIGDKARLNQILINLVGNAIKFTDKGIIKITAKPIEKVNNSTRVLFEVIDEGIGIPENKLEKIFESFTQAESDTSLHYGGTGLGLSISKHLIQLQNGSISVKSEVGKGSTFIFELPFDIGKEIKEKTSQNKTADKLSGISILIAEDNEFNAMVAKDELKSLIKSVKIRIVENGEKALEYINKYDFDLILMDIEMPVMNGCEASLKIRKMQSSKSKIPILAMTANVAQEDIEKCYSHGINDVITKPYNTDELFTKIIGLLT